ncbi:hypothetical protein B0H63DRAFT_474076 [Podospora didyma]|uniref:Uncharacterized protein n=1 Tax=Podospora didyma TaxID=330526 RepID=A0AAE0NQU7_9PEZI|nr:hypothetical protein B0H63DRAFT_474076 [Podospora didyma]
MADMVVVTEVVVMAAGTQVLQVGLEVREELMAAVMGLVRAATVAVVAAMAFQRRRWR